MGTETPGLVRQPGADPDADRQQRDLAERDHPDPAVEEPEAGRGDRVDRHAREGGDPVSSKNSGIAKMTNGEQSRGDHDRPHEVAPVDVEGGEANRRSGQSCSVPATCSSR